MLFCAVGSISLVIIFSSIAAIKKLKFSDEQEFINGVGTTVLIIFGTGLASIGIALAMSRIKISWQLKDIKSTVLLLTITTLISFLILLLIWLYHRGTVSNLLKKIRTLCLLTQALMPLAFLAIIPTPWRISQSKLLGYPLHSTLIFLIAALMSLAYFDLFKRIKYQPDINKRLIKSALSPLCLTGLLFWIKLPAIEVSSIKS